MTNRASGTSRTTRAAASTRCLCPLCGTSAATLPTIGAWCGSHNSSCSFAGGAAATRPRSMPSWTVTVRASGTPSAISICRIVSDAQMKQSTCRYFQRERALPRRWKSTRRDATSGGLTGPVLIDKASAAIATPCGSCAWTMAGRSCLMRRDSRHAAPRSISVRGASGSRSSPSAARWRSSPPGCATSIVRWPSARRPITVTSTWFWPPRHVRAVSMCRENIRTLWRSAYTGRGPADQGSRDGLRQRGPHRFRWSSRASPASGTRNTS